MNFFSIIMPILVILLFLFIKYISFPLYSYDFWFNYRYENESVCSYKINNNFFLNNCHYLMKQNSSFNYYGTSMFTLPVNIRINSQGFRGKEISKIVKENTTRILLLGNSMVFGLSNSENNTISVLLEKSLNFNSLNKYEVINGGKPGLELFHQYFAYRQRFEEFNSDIIILLQIDNISRNCLVFQDFFIFSKLLFNNNKSYLYNYSNTFFIQNKIKDIKSYRDFLEIAYNWNSYYKFKQKNITETEKYCIYYPLSWFNNITNKKIILFVSKDETEVISYAKKINMTVFEMNYSINELRSNYNIFPIKELHLTPKGNKFISDIVNNGLFELNLTFKNLEGEIK